MRGADVVCLCTDSSEPVISHDWLAPGTHVTSVGYAPPGGELDPSVMSMAASSWRPGWRSSHHRLGARGSLAEIRARARAGQVLLGSGLGRQSDNEVTVYKAMGDACEDLAGAAWSIAVPSERALAAS